jgi:hypothetical protein
MTAGSGWCRFRQPSFHTAVRSDHRMLSPVSAISAASAKLDFPDPFRPVMTVSPGPACRWSVTASANATKPLHADRLQVDPPRRADLSLFVVLVHAAVPATAHRGADQARDLIGNLIVGELRADDLRNTASLLRHVSNNTGIIWSSHEIQGTDSWLLVD